MIGIILLMGIVEKNAIMLVDFALEAERQLGLSPEQAIHEACLERFRPIMMTTLAALLGAVPLAVAFGTGADSAAARDFHYRRPDRVADADALHNAGRVPRAGTARRQTPADRGAGRIINTAD